MLSFFRFVGCGLCGFLLMAQVGCHVANNHVVANGGSLWSYGKPKSTTDQCLMRCEQQWRNEKVRCTRVHEGCSVKTVAGGLKSYPKGYLSYRANSGSVVHYTADVTDPIALRRTGDCAQRIQGCQKEALQDKGSCEKSCR